MAAPGGSWERFLGPRVDGAAPAATVVALAAALALGGGALALLLDYGPGRDQAIYRLVAAVMLDGGTPYRDAWDFKPPGIFAVYALASAVFGDGERAARLLEALGLLSLAPAFWVLSRRALGDGRAGLLGASLAWLTTAALGFWDTGQPEVFGGLLMVWALVAATAPTDRGARTLLAWLAAGALYGAAALLKPHLGAGILVSVGFAVAGSRPAGRWRAPLAFAAGGVLPVALTLAWFAAREALTPLHEALFVFAPRYAALTLEEPGPLELLIRTVSPLLRFGTPQLLGLGLALALPPLAAAERRHTAHVLGVVALVLLGIGVQAKFFPYHYAAVLMLLALPAGWGAWKLWLAAADRPAAWLALGVGLLLLAAPLHPGGRQLALFASRAAVRVEAARRLPPERERIRDRLHSLADVDAGSNRRAARWLAENTPAEQPIYVWGFEPGIYTLAGREPASRFVYNVPQRADWSSGEARLELMQELAARPPSAIVVVSGDRFPHVTGNARDGAEELRGFAELRALLDRGYRQAARFGDLEIHVLRGPG